MEPSISRTQKAAITGALFFVLSAAVQGIIGNRADASLPLIGSFLAQEIQLPISSLVLIITASICIPSVFLVYSQAAYRNATSLNRIDGTLNRSIAILHRSRKLDERADMAKQMTDFLLGNVLCVSLFQSCGIAVYCPDDSSTRLVPWVRKGNPNRSSETLSFYIGDLNSYYLGESEIGTPAEKVRGDVGSTFMDGKLRLVQFSREGEDLNGSGSRREHDSGGIYRSLICVAISSGNPHTGHLGVLCLYGKRERTFNSAAKEFITAIAQRLSIILEAIAEDPTTSGSA